MSASPMLQTYRLFQSVESEDIVASDDCRGVQFNETATTVPPITGLHPFGAEVGSRSVHDRLPTPYASAREFKEDGKVAINDFGKETFAGFQKSVRVLPTADVEEIEAESSREQLRSSRDRMPTPHVSSQMVEETFSNSAKTVRIFPAADVEAIPISGEGRSTRERIATPFMKDDEPFEDARSVHFSTEVSRGPDTRPSFGAVEEIKMEIAQDHHLRTSRERMPTPHVRMDLIEAASQDSPTDSADRHVRISFAPQVEAVPLTGGRRPSRDRIPTPFYKDGLHIMHHLVVARKSRPKSLQTARCGEEPVSEETKHVRISNAADIEEIKMEIAQDHHLRTSRERMPTPHVRMDLIEATSQDSPTDSADRHVRISFAPQAVPLTGGRRPSRDRIPTPFFKEQLPEERAVQFNDGDEVAHHASFGGSEEIETEVPADSMMLRSRDRIATPHVRLDFMEEPVSKDAKHDKHVRISNAADIKAVPVSGERRPSRDRIPTPFDLVESDDYREVQFSDTVTTVLPSQVPPITGLHPFGAQVGSRSVHDRLPTPYASAREFQEDGKVAINAFGQVQEFEVHDPKNSLRSSRDRVPTPHVSNELIEETFAGFQKSVRVLPTADVEAIPAAKDTRSSRDRIATPFVKEDEMLGDRAVNFEDTTNSAAGVDAQSCEAPDSRTVSFRPASLIEFDNISPISDEAVVPRRGIPWKSVRDRQQTSWVEDRKVKFKDASPESQVPIARTYDGQDPEAEGSRSRGGSDPDDPPSDAESISASSASSRNPRSRMSTPFMSAVDWGYDVSVPSGQASATPESVSGSSGRRRRSKPTTLEPCSSSTDRNLVKQVSIESSIEREISERVKLNAQRQAREERLVRVGSTDANVPLALERCSSADGGNPEADLANHIVEDGVKDTEMVINTLRNLVFFETFDDEALHSLIEAMEVYEFMHGEKVVRQGDTDGTHFFVVAQGEFCVLKDNVAHCYIGPGTSFGESVLLLFGERSATVCAQGCARAYGMEGMQVRELLSAQYEQRRLSIVDAMDEVLKSHVCEILSGLNGYQLQSLYDQVEMKTFEAGDEILKEGETTKEVLILYSGEVQSWSRDQKMDNIGRYHLMGDRALVHKDELPFQQPTTLKAETAVEVLVLKHSLLDNLFGDELPQVLVKHRVLYVLAKHQDFSRLHPENREAVASSCQIRLLPKGSEHSWEDVRVMVALNGEVDLTLDEIGMQHLTGASPTMFSIPYNDQLAPLKVKALADSKLAVWQREDLGSILAFENFDGAVEQDSKVRSLQSVFIFATLSMEQLKRLAAALEIETVKRGAKVFSQGDFGTHFYIIRKGVVSVEIDGREKRRLGAPDYFGDRALLGSEIRSASIAALEDTELWKMGKETFQEMMQGPCLDYLKDRISLQDTNLTFSDLEYVRVIGRGGFGIVKMVRANKTGVRYALKCVRKRDVVEKNVQDALVSELSILKEVDHPFIIKFVRSFRNESRVYFLMELVSGGELLDALDSLGLLKDHQALFYTGSIVLALEFLHARRIAYLDLKSENCLIDQQGYLKIIDFGIARRITNTRYGPLKGTPMFMAPEMILGKGHTTVADLWSLGICLYEFVIGNFPFASNCSNHGAIFHEILRADLKFPQWFEKQPSADDIMSLIRGLLTRDPKKRLGAGHEGYAKLKKHAFFRDLCWERLLGRELVPPFVPKSETYAECESSRHNYSMLWTKKSQRCLQQTITCPRWKKRRHAALRKKNHGRTQLLVGMQISSGVEGDSAATVSLVQSWLMCQDANLPVQGMLTVASPYAPLIRCLLGTNWSICASNSQTCTGSQSFTLSDTS
eukprot:s1026_g9.t2